ncbi:MAG: vWA domain-containing protein [Acidobacteriota bacterium]
MKRKPLGLLVSLAFAVLVAPASASESFTLNIPLRFNASQETGEVRILLTLDAAPAGAQLVVGGTTTLNLGETKPAGGDSVTFETATGNDVRITYRPLSNFGADFCSGGAAVEKNIPMRFSGAQNVTDYRVSTYIVASPMVECSAVSKHTGDTPANLIPIDDGVAPALTATNRGRNTFDVVLVLDKSGSMADFPPGAISGAKKDQILKSALTAFVAQWRQLDQPAVTGEEWSHDRLGVVFFDHAVTPQTLAGADPPANFFVQRGAGLPGPWDAVINDIGTLTPGGATSIGGGINEGMKQWKSDPANDLSLVVVTDGIQNSAPLIQPAPSGFLGLLPVSGLPQELRTRFIPIQTIGFGAPAAVDEDLLRNVSFETSGVSYIALNAATMFDVFSSTLVALLKGNTASLAARQHGTLTGKGPGAPQPVLVDRSAQRVVFTLQWAPPLSDALDLEVFRPAAAPGAGAAAPSSSEMLPQAAIQTFNLAPGAEGTWTVRVKRGRRANSEPVPYTLNVLFLEKHLDYQLSFENVHAATGDSLRLRAVVDWDGKPLTSLPSDAIRVRIQRPGEALGTILHGARVADQSKGNATMPGDTQTPYDRKVAALVRQGLLTRIQPKDIATITLKEQGRGVYVGTFDQTSIPGTYGFEAVLDWDDARTGHLRRQERLEQFVKVKADPGKTEITTSRLARGKVLISVTPRDRYGNYLGPGYGSRIKLTLEGAGKLVGDLPIDRDQTGTYVFTLTDVPAGDTPDAGVTVDGVEVGRTRK